jgi:hypothetical protein
MEQYPRLGIFISTNRNFPPKSAYKKSKIMVKPFLEAWLFLVLGKPGGWPIILFVPNDRHHFGSVTPA